MRQKILFAFLFLVSFASSFVHCQNAVAEDKAFSPAIVYGLGTKFDKSFNEAAYQGMEKFKQETGIPYKESETMNETHGEQYLRQLARRGSDIIVTTGFDQSKPVEKVAKEFPNVKFTLIDAVVDLPNVQSIVFKDHEGSFLVGALAAMKSQTGKLGFVGGMDIPLIKRFSCGYIQGAKYVNKDIELFQNMVGTTQAAWADPTKGGELAISQFERGVDVIYSAAGRSGVGVLQAAADKDKYGIGVDSNQNYLYPGHVLTSMVKRIDLAAYRAVKDAHDGTWKPGVVHYGVKDDGVEWAYDEYNKSLISEDMLAKLKQMKQDIIDGKIKIVNYTEANSCPY